MAKAKRLRTHREQGPFLDAAFICEEVIKEKDGTYSAIRMVNKITFHDETFDHGTLLQMPLILVISFKAGDVRGTRHLSLYVTNPSGKRTPLEGFVFPHPLTFIGGDTGPFIALRYFALKYERDGTYWIDVLLEKKRYSRLPLTVRTAQVSENPLSETL
jgi:hypothetical protein